MQWTFCRCVCVCVCGGGGGVSMNACEGMKADLGLGLKVCLCLFCLCLSALLWTEATSARRQLRPDAAKSQPRLQDERHRQWHAVNIVLMQGLTRFDFLQFRLFKLLSGVDFSCGCLISSATFWCVYDVFLCWHPLLVGFPPFMCLTCVSSPPRPPSFVLKQNCLLQLPSPGPLFPGEFQHSFCFVSLESQWVTFACSPPVLDSSSGLVPLPWATTDLVMTFQTECTTLRACAEFPPFVIPLVPINITFWFTLSTNTVKRKYRCNLLSVFCCSFFGKSVPIFHTE